MRGFAEAPNRTVSLAFAPDGGALFAAGYREADARYTGPVGRGRGAGAPRFISFHFTHTAPRFT
jgi:hypothetical protein